MIRSLIVSTSLLLSANLSIAQNNVYPTSGDVKIYSGNSSWGEGIAIIKPSGWSGIRFTRNDPAGGNYSGNWALGYNYYTGNDFSISTNYNGTQYDGLFHISNTTRYVGVGTTNPLAKFHIFDGTPSSAQGINGATKLAIDAPGGGFAEFRSTADNNTFSGILFTDNNLGGYVTFRNYPDDRLHLGGYAGLSFEVGSDNSVGGKIERLRIDQNGNVGIGTVTPDAKLTVQGDTKVDGITRLMSNSTDTNPGASWSSALWVYNNSNSIGTFSRMGFVSGVDGLGGISVQKMGTYNGDMHFQVRNGGGYFLTPMMIRSDGNIGIGTMNPGSYKLAVEGKIGAREVNVTTTAWSDYVFNADYKLRSLAEVQQYIEENHHLPEVPSEKEVLANGQNLGEMNAILLKKIEELTLYVIDLKRENESMKTRLEKIENQNK